MIDVLTAHPLLTLMLVVAGGAALGAVPFGPLRLGAAGALFVGLALGALDPALGEGWTSVQNLGLILFVYCVGLAAGETFFSDVRRQLPLMLTTVAVLGLVAAGAALLGWALGLSAGAITGVYAGSLTSTPALAAATDATGSPDAAVGYSIGYPVGVVLAIVVVALVVGRSWPGPKDPLPESAEGLAAWSVVVDQHLPLHRVPGWDEETIKISYLVREGVTGVLYPGQDLLAGDEVLVVGAPGAVRAAAQVIGHPRERDLTENRASVDFRRITVSDDAAIGRTVAQLQLPAKFGAVITRVRRGDTDLLAKNSLTLQPGDRVLAVAPSATLDEVASYLGNSERKVSQFNPLGFGLGIALGLLLGAIPLPMLGGTTFTLGSAAGPLIVGMILGKVHTSGPVQWVMPLSANLTLRQLGLLLFLAAVGLASGQQFAAEAFTADGLRTGAVAAFVVIASAVALLAAGRLLGLSAPRTAGAFAGYLGQPAVLSFAEQRVVDERIGSGYAALFALAIIIKILAVNVVGAVMA